MSNINIQQPQPFDLVNDKIMIAGNAVGFEGTISIYISDGHNEVRSYTQAGGMAIAQFQAIVTIPPDIEFNLDRLTIRVSDDTAGDDEAPSPTMVVPVLYGPRILPGYFGYWEHTVVSGETLSKIARKYYNEGSMWNVVARANFDRIADPDIIFPGQILRIPRNEI